MTSTVKTKRMHTSVIGMTENRAKKRTKRRIRWDRVITYVVLPVVFVSVVCRTLQNIRAKNEQNATGIASVNEALEGNCNSVVDNNVVESVEKVTTEVPSKKVTKQKNIVVTEEDAGFKLKIKASNQKMGVMENYYYSKKLGYEVTDRDVKMLMMLVLSEGAWEPHDAQVSIAATVLNRVLYDDRMFPDTIEKVITQPNQFSPVIMKNPERAYEEGYNGFYHQGGKVEVKWDDYSESVQVSVRQAVYEALDGTDPTKSVGGALYYCNMSQLPYEELVYRNNIGETVAFGHTTFYREW